jgi:hypothetical protein
MLEDMETHLHTSRDPIWLLELPMELVIKIMMHLDYKGLESLVELLDRPLPGLIQTVIESEWWTHPENHSRTMKNVRLEDLKTPQHKCLINLVDIQELEERQSSEISEMAEVLSGSINHINLSRLFGTTFKDYREGIDDRVMKLVNLLPDSRFIT